MTSTAAGDSYSYDSDGAVTIGSLFERRIDKATGQVTDTSFYAGPDGTTAAMSIDGSIVHVYTDRLGSVAATWDPATGVISHQNYYPYGEIRQTDGLDTTVGYTGQRHDPSGLIYYQARYYDPHTGWFTQADTIVSGGGARCDWASGFYWVAVHGYGDGGPLPGMGIWTPNPFPWDGWLPR